MVSRGAREMNHNEITLKTRLMNINILDHQFNDHSQAWSNKDAKGNCALMSSYGKEAANNNVISGPKIC